MGTGTTDEGGGPLDGGLFLVNRFTATVDDPSLPFLVTLVLVAHGRRLAPEAVNLKMRPGGIPITATNLRAVKVDAYVARIRDEVGALDGGLLIVRRQEDSQSIRWSGVPDGDWSRFEDSQNRRRRPADTLPAVAEAYREALGHPDSQIAAAPTMYVAEKLFYSRGHASRLVTQARKVGLLGDAIPGRAGEIAQSEMEGNQ